MLKMDWPGFDGLRVIRREWESRIGSSDVCAAADGAFWICLRLRAQACQMNFLSGCPHAAVRLRRGILEVLLPYQDGERLCRWEQEQPTLGRRRAACLSIVAQCIAAKLPPCVIALSALPENLRFTPDGALLQMLPNWEHWSDGLGEPEAVCAVAALCRELLTPPGRRFGRRHPPIPVRLLYQRADGADYLNWGQLQRDLSEIPDVWPSAAHQLLSGAGPLAARALGIAKPALCVAAAVLLAAALLSVTERYQAWQMEQEQMWPGVRVIGDQILEPEGAAP